MYQRWVGYMCQCVSEMSKLPNLRDKFRLCSETPLPITVVAEAFVYVI